MHNNIDIFIEDGIRLSPVEITHQGLASILCYDAFLPRCIEGIRAVFDRFESMRDSLAG